MYHVEDSSEIFTPEYRLYRHDIDNNEALIQALWRISGEMYDQYADSQRELYRCRRELYGLYENPEEHNT